MAEFKVDGRMKVKKLKELFKEEFGGTLRVYNGNKIASDDATLASIRCNDNAICGEFTCRASRTVGKFCEEFLNDFGVKVKVATPDDWVLVLDGITLATLKELPKNATTDILKKYEAYKREDSGTKDETETQIPNNEIWFTAEEFSKEEEENLRNSKQFNTSVADISFLNGKGIIRFEEDLTTIKWLAFNNMNFKTIVIPECVTDLNFNVFDTCSQLESVICRYSSSDHKALIQDKKLYKVLSRGLESNYKVPEGVEIIGHFAFKDNDTIEELIIPQECNQIETEAINELKKLKRITFKSSLKSNKAISNPSIVYYEGPNVTEDHRCVIINGELLGFAASGLEEYSIPEGVKSIASGAIPSNETIKQLTIPESCSEVNLSNLNALTKITFKGEISISTNPFSNTAPLEIIEGPQASEDHKCLIINDTLIAVARNGLSEEYTLPEGIERIEGQAITNCEIRHLIVQSECKSLGNLSIFKCNLLEKITFLGTLEEVENQFIDDHESLTTFEGPNASEDGRCLIIENRLVAFAACGISEYVIPMGVETLCEGVFNYCDKFSQIVIPPSVCTFDGVALDLCQCTNDNIDLYMLSKSPIIIDDYNTIIYTGGSFSGNIYVPFESLEQYKETEGWEDELAEYVKPIPQDFCNPYGETAKDKN